MNPKKIIKEYNGIGRIDSCNLPDVEVRFCQYSDGEIKGEVKNINDRHVAEFWNSMKDFPPLTIRGNISSGDSFVFHSFYAAHPTTELVGKDFEVTRIGVVEDYQKYDFEIQFGLLQLSLFQPIKCNPKCDPSFNEFIISPVQNIKEILEETLMTLRLTHEYENVAQMPQALSQTSPPYTHETGNTGRLIYGGSF